MKITIFRTTGRTGQYLIPQALEAGHEVTALVRTPSKLTIEHNDLTVIQVDVTNADEVYDAMANAEVVISVLGPTSNKPEYLVSQSMEYIVAAMDKHGIRRLVVSAGAGVVDPNDDPKFINKVFGFLIRTISGYVYEGMVRTVEAVRASDLDWTIVRVPMLMDDPTKGEVKVAYVGKGMGSRITRAEMASFIPKQVEDRTYLHQAPAISN